MPRSPRPVLLIVQRPADEARVSPHLAHLFAALNCVQLGSSIYTLPTDSGRDDGLRRFVKECAAAGGSVWLFAELDDLAPDDKTYVLCMIAANTTPRLLSRGEKGSGPCPLWGRANSFDCEPEGKGKHRSFNGLLPLLSGSLFLAGPSGSRPSRVDP